MVRFICLLLTCFDSSSSSPKCLPSSATRLKCVAFVYLQSCNPDDDAEDNARSSRAKKKPLFDVEEYLSGVLWNLQMYVDGYVPNYYWHYSPRYSPSVADILFWIQNNGALLAKVSPPVTQAPPLPAAIACLCMLPMTQSGRAFLPQRLQPLVKINSPLLEALEWRGATSGLDIPKILRFIQEKAPDELRDFHDGSHSRCDSCACVRRVVVKVAAGISNRGGVACRFLPGASLSDIFSCC